MGKKGFLLSIVNSMIKSTRAMRDPHLVIDGTKGLNSKEVIDEPTYAEKRKATRRHLYENEGDASGIPYKRNYMSRSRGYSNPMRYEVSSPPTAYYSSFAVTSTSHSQKTQRLGMAR